MIEQNPPELSDNREDDRMLIDALNGKRAEVLSEIINYPDFLFEDKVILVTHLIREHKKENGEELPADLTEAREALLEYGKRNESLRSTTD